MCPLARRCFLLLLLVCDWQAGPEEQPCGLSPTASPLAATDVACYSLSGCGRATRAAAPLHVPPPLPGALPDTLRVQGPCLPPQPLSWRPAAPAGGDLLYALRSLRR
jgi:hypothetical protein